LNHPSLSKVETVHEINLGPAFYKVVYEQQRLSK